MSDLDELHSQNLPPHHAVAFRYFRGTEALVDAVWQGMGTGSPDLKQSGVAGLPLDVRGAQIDGPTPSVHGAQFQLWVLTRVELQQVTGEGGPVCRNNLERGASGPPETLLRLGCLGDQGQGRRHRIVSANEGGGEDLVALAVLVEHVVGGHRAGSQAGHGHEIPPRSRWWRLVAGRIASRGRNGLQRDRDSVVPAR